MHMARRAAAWAAWAEWTCNTGRGRPPPKAGDVERERASARSFFVGASRPQVLDLEKGKFEGIGIDDVVLDACEPGVGLVLVQFGNPRRPAGFFELQPAVEQWHDDIIIFVAMPACFRAGRESKFRDPHVRLVDLDGCNSLGATGHNGFLSVGGIVGSEAKADSATRASAQGRRSPERTIRFVWLHSRRVRMSFRRAREGCRNEQGICALGRCWFAVLHCFARSGSDAVRGQTATISPRLPLARDSMHVKLSAASDSGGTSRAVNWSARQYVQFEDERTRPVRDLLAALPAIVARTVIDVGCGPGNSTELLAARFSGAAVSGLDSSTDMIAAARRRLPGLQFDLTDVEKWVYESDAGNASGDAGAAAGAAPFDVILANAVLHWVPDHARLFPALAAKLAPGGALAVQMPDNLGEPAHCLMREIAADGPWAAKLSAAA